MGWFILIEVSDEGSWFYYMYIQPGCVPYFFPPKALSVRCPILVDDFSCGEKSSCGHWKHGYVIRASLSGFFLLCAWISVH